MSISPTLLTALAIASVVTFIASLILIPIIITRLSSDHFLNKQHFSITSTMQKASFISPKQLLKNLLGIIFIIAGIAMLVLPGQGVLTILIGLGITNFPGKHKLERKLVKNRQVFKSLNWIRRRAGAEPFLYPK